MAFIAEIFSSPVKIISITVCFLSLALVIYTYLSKKLEQKKTILRRLTQEELQQSWLDGLLDKVSWLVKREAKFNEEIDVLDMNITARLFTKMRLASVFLSVIVSIYLQNWLVVIPLTLIVSAVPKTYVEYKVNKKRVLFEEQIFEAFQVFITDFTTSRNVLQTISNMGAKLKYPLKGEFERLSRLLYSGVTPKDAFGSFSERTRNRWAKVYSQMMIMYTEDGGDFVPHMMNVIKYMANDRVTEQQNATEMAALRGLNILLNLAIPVAYLAQRYMYPESAYVYSETPHGRILVFVVACASLVSLFIGKRIADAV